LTLMRLRAVLRLTWLAALAATVTPALMASEEVRIGAAHFPPYVIRPEGSQVVGLIADLATALNQVQQRYHFVLVPTSLPRRFHDLEQGRIDMAVFENPEWGWQDIPHIAVDLGLEDAEVFVAKRSPGRDQSYFRNLEGKRLALVLGYHYAFAGFDADPQKLARLYSASVTYSHDSNLLMVLRDRADIAPVTRSYLSDYSNRHPERVAGLLVSERIDQLYHHYTLLRPGAPISPQELRKLLALLHERGDMARIFKPYQIALVPLRP
jgi:ABC-type amino acid transport substrate-binding protein